MAARGQSTTGPFPNEIWQMMFECGEQKDFYKISFVSRCLHELVEPYLYREFNWIPREVIPQLWALHEGNRPWFIPAPPPPFLLLRTLIKRPELARYVKHVKLLVVPPQFRLFWATTEAKILNDKELFFCWKHLLETSSNGMPHWKILLLEGSLDVVIGMLLVILRNLSSAELRVRDGLTIENIVFEALHYNYRRKESFTKRPIKSVTISFDNDSDRTWTGKDWWGPEYRNIHRIEHQMFDLALLPQLEHLSVSNLHDLVDWNPGFGTTIYDPALYSKLATNLKRLNLRHSLLTEPGLESVLIDTKHLEDLECDLQYDCRLSEFCFGDRISTVLSKVSETLKRLKLDIEVQNGVGVDNHGIETSMGSMKNFKKLRSLEIPLILIIPRSNDISAELLDGILPDELDNLIMGVNPLIPSLMRRALACHALHNYLLRRPHLRKDGPIGALNLASGDYFL